MATKTSQRVFIWVIAIVMTVGTLAGFIALILAPENQKVDQARIQELTATYQKQVQDQAKELSGKYFTEFSGYGSRVAAFDATSVSELGKEDLKMGNGETLTKDSTFTAYYIGWNPSGEIFDQSIDGSSLKAPFEASPGGVISGWTEGVDGMKIGGVRELTIPAAKAYGETGQGDKIPPNTPLKFVIMVIPAPKQIPIPAELQNYYANQAQ